jgi:hypothetical protein
MITKLVQPGREVHPRGEITFTIENRGRSTFRVTHAGTAGQVGNPDFQGLVEIVPGGSQDLILEVNLPSNMSTAHMGAVFDIVASDRRKFQQQNQWTLDLSGADSHKTTVSRLVEAGGPD